MIQDSRDKRLGFLVAGVQKGGTTSLFQYLRSHNELSPPASKEIHFFDDESVDWNNPPYSRLHESFPHNDFGLRFEATPIYIYWPDSVKRIHQYNREIKLILIFRDPIIRAWSHWKMEFARQAESIPFHAAIRQGRWRLRGTQKWGVEHRVFSYVERGFYTEQVNRILTFFPRNQVLFLKTDDLSKNHANVLSRIADFVGISEFADLPSIRENSAPEFAYPSRLEIDDIKYLRQIFVDDLIQFGELTNLDIRDWLTMAETV